jgi:hypothetical protein
MPASSIPALSGLRAVVGVGAWATPNVSGRLFGLDPVGNPQASYVGRLFGARDLALAAGTLTSEGEARRRWIQMGLACDLADAAAGYIAGARVSCPSRRPSWSRASRSSQPGWARPRSPPTAPRTPAPIPA